MQLEVLYVDGTHRRPGRLTWDDGRLRFARERAAGPDGDADAVVRSVKGQLIALPGLVNAHDHLHLNAFGALMPRAPYAHASDWAADMAGRLTAPEVTRMRELPVAVRAWHGGLKNALAGATTVVHHDPWFDVFDDPDFPAHVVPDTGWAHSLDLGEGLSHPNYGPEVVKSFRATPRGRPWFVHAAEGVDERAAAEVPRLFELGCVGPASRLVHGVGIRPDDAAAAREAGAALVWCPESNRRLLGRVADVAPWLPGHLALGTDSRLTGSRDLLAELHAGASLRPDVASVLLEAVTASGRALCGTDEPDPAALDDVVLLRATRSTPAASLVATGRRDLRLVVRGGRPVVGDPDLAAMFDDAGVDWVRARLDGRPKLVAKWALRGADLRATPEPGLELDAGSRDRRSTSASRRAVA